MAEIFLVHVAEVRIHAVIVEVNVFLGVTRPDPRLLHGHVDILQVRRRILPGFLDPVVTVVSNRTDQLIERNFLLRDLEILREPFLRSHRSGFILRLVLVIIH